MHKINLGDKTLNYEIIRTDRKTIGLGIDESKLITVRAPKKIEQEKVMSVLKDKSSWILEKIKEIDSIKPAPKPKEFLSGEKLPYLGRRYRLKVEKDEGIKRVEVKLYKGKFYIEYPGDYNSESERIEGIREAVVNWYREHARVKLKERIEEYKEQLDVEPNKVFIKNQKTRWGSCSSRKNLNFNWKIIMAPMSIADYVVAHELTHLLYDNHSKEFWQTLGSVIPDYEERLEWLKVNGRRLDL